MAFSESERQQLLELKFVGSKIVDRLEQMQLDSFDKLRKVTSDEILNQGVLLTGSVC